MLCDLLLVFLFALAGAFLAGAVIAVARFFVVLAAPAVGAELVFGEPDGVNHVVDALEG